jgi:hypothetical protein
MTMGEFRSQTEHVPDWWPLQISDDQQRLHHVDDYVIAPELGDRVVLIPREETSK